MANISASAVNELRQATGCGLMDCKKALIETDGDFDKAVTYLREKGLASQAKKATRVAAEGLAYAAVIDGIGVVHRTVHRCDQSNGHILPRCRERSPSRRSRLPRRRI